MQRNLPGKRKDMSVISQNSSKRCQSCQNMEVQTKHGASNPLALKPEPKTNIHFKSNNLSSQTKPLETNTNKLKIDFAPSAVKIINSPQLKNETQNLVIKNAKPEKSKSPSLRPQSARKTRQENSNEKIKDRSSKVSIITPMDAISNDSTDLTKDEGQENYPEIKKIIAACTERINSPQNRSKSEEKPISKVPASAKNAIVSPEIQQTIDSLTKRSSSCVESKHKITITSERLAQLRKMVDTAVREHKVFSCKGGWTVVRRGLLQRGYIEKIEPNKKTSLNPGKDDEITSNLPAKQDWESNAAYVEKCEKTVMSRMLQHCEVDFYWSMRKEPSDLQQRAHTYTLINRFSRSLFSSKEGLALLLSQSYWYTEPGVASINFPRCYVLGFPDHFNLFVDDFRMTACIGILKWFVNKFNPKDKYSVQSSEGNVQFSVLQFAIDRCKEHIDSQKHLDIDKDVLKIYDHEWDEFLKYYYALLHENGMFMFSKDNYLITYYEKIQSVLSELQKYWPEYHIDGMKNIWIVKPGNKCRGRGIQLIKNLEDVEKLMNLKLKYVVQKYIGKRESYLRFSSQIFSLENFHESLHLTNHAVQCKYPNVQQRNKNLPDDNMWDCHTFKTYLKQLGCMEKWDQIVYPGMRESIICAMLSSQDTMDRRQNTYEIYGADFMISEDCKPWLIEINCSPDLSFSTTVTSRMCAKCMEDILKVVIDKRKDPKADTGLFDLVYKQNMPRAPPYLGMNLSVRGRKLFRHRYKNKEEKKEKKYQLIDMKRKELLKNEFVTDNDIIKTFPAISPPSDLYKGPMIQDLIEELHKSFNADDGSGVDFVPALKVQTPVKKKYNENLRTERVQPKKERISNLRKTNKNYSFCRNQNAKENKLQSRKSNFYEHFRQWSLKNKLPSDYMQNDWEKETFSILKGKNVFIDGNYINKNYIKND